MLLYQFCLFKLSALLALHKRLCGGILCATLWSRIYCLVSIFIFLLRVALHNLAKSQCIWQVGFCFLSQSVGLSPLHTVMSHIWNIVDFKCDCVLPFSIKSPWFLVLKHALSFVTFFLQYTVSIIRCATYDMGWAPQKVTNDPAGEGMCLQVWMDGGCWLASAYFSVQAFKQSKMAFSIQAAQRHVG